ncbi:sulfotransferase family 2 domain-containing protein [Alisedimentitalea sp. MJ-SS2]|uniref:sulfotransferase family 2 domain-containing protein n=1 Tax=Aliisedimentitalea sp. MJ-SS2 TaxID=3049795 RepID=UPI00290914AB|nr:sulfotransferase family 2 domain-containing protein [Alisedimentitalea sp. MJ-SS2]MDU8926153.1 sulfotransferase family 2 domain-containing protein [Alisedimentitalea sp. MJ-SS2]
MPLARLGQTLVFFAHIPKTGGTSIETYLRSKGQVTMHSGVDLEWLPCSPQHMHVELHGALLEPGFCDYTFAVLRDPVERMKSEYRHRSKRASDRGKHVASFDEWAPRVLKLSRNQPYLYDNHLRPQTEFVTPDMRLFRLEGGLDPVYDWIDTLGGNPVVPSRDWKRNLSHGQVEVAPETETFIRGFYAMDYALLADISDTAGA